MYVVESQEQHEVLVRDEESNTQLYVTTTTNETTRYVCAWWRDYYYVRDVLYDQELLEFMNDEENQERFFSVAKKHAAKLKGWN